MSRIIQTCIIMAVVVAFVAATGCTDNAFKSQSTASVEQPTPVVSVRIYQIGEKAYVEAKNVGGGAHSFLVGIRETNSDGVVVGEHIVRIPTISPGETGKDFTYVESRNSNVRIANVGVMVGGELKLVHFQETEKNCTEVGTSEDGRTHTMSCETKVIRSV